MLQVVTSEPQWFGVFGKGPASLQRTRRSPLVNRLRKFKHCCNCCSPNRTADPIRAHDLLRGLGLVLLRCPNPVRETSKTRPVPWENIEAHCKRGALATVPD